MEQLDNIQVKNKCICNRTAEATVATPAQAPQCPPPCPCLCECVKDIVDIHNSRCIVDTFIFKKGFQFFRIQGTRSVVVSYGICVKYVDCEGCQRTTNKIGSVIFFDIPACFGDDITVHIPGCPRVDEDCPNAVKVEFPVIICD